MARDLRAAAARRRQAWRARRRRQRTLLAALERRGDAAALSRALAEDASADVPLWLAVEGGDGAFRRAGAHADGDDASGTAHL